MLSPLHILADQEALSLVEKKKRTDQSIKRPRVHEKIQNYFKGMLDGQISPILRLKINRSLCNFHCAHCCEEPYMSRDLKKKTGSLDPRPQMSLEDYRKLSQEADDFGIFRFVLTGGEALLDKNLDKLIDALDPQKHLIILDTNGWTFDTEKAKWWVVSPDNRFESILKEQGFNFLQVRMRVLRMGMVSPTCINLAHRGVQASGREHEGAQLHST
jgi:organic radical activating enzyme